MVKLNTKSIIQIKIWAANTYNNPEFVTKSDIEDEKLRFDGLWNIKS